jgi:gluconokinase
MGVSGTGKTTVGKLLAQSLRASFCDADDLHPSANVDKMTHGEPLSDEDRWPWLQRVKARIDEAIGPGETRVVACSALKRSYRALLSMGTNDLRLVFLKGTKEVLTGRLASRHGHFMQAILLDSQFAALEEPTLDEALIVDIKTSPEEIVAQIRKWLNG